MRNKGLLFIALIIISVIPATAKAHAMPLSINDAVMIALKNNPELLMLSKRLDSAERVVKAKEAIRYGEIYFNGGFKKTGENFIVYPMYKEAFSVSSGLPFDDEYFYYSLTYNIPIYTGGRITENIQLSELQHTQQFLRIRIFKNNLIFRIKEVYLRILSIDKRLESIRSGMAAVESVIKHIEEGIEIGKFAKIDLLKAEAKLEEFVKVKAQLQSERERLYNTLLYLMGEKMTIEYDLISMDPNCEDEFNTLDKDELVNKAIRKRSDLKFLRSQIQAVQSKLKIKRSERLPQITFSAGYNGTNAEGIDFERGYYQASINLRIPLFTFGRLNHEYISVKAEKEALLMNLEYKKIEIQREVMDALSQYKMALAQINSLETQLKLARKVEDIEDLKYQNGRGKIDDLLLAIANTVDAEADLFNARVQLCIAYESIVKATEGGI